MRSHAELERLKGEARRSDELPEGLRDSPSQLVALQQSMGNAAVTRMLERTSGRQGPPAAAPASATPLETHSETQSFRLNAAIRIGPGPGPAPARVAYGADDDTEAGQDIHEELVAGEPLAATTMAPPAAAPPAAAASAAAPAAEGATPQSAAGGPAPEEAPVSLPDIEVRDFEDVELCDAVSPWLSYSGTVAQGGATPTGFGVTRPGPMNVTGITVRKLPVLGWWYVSATITQQILYQVRAATGPSGQVNVTGAFDPVITSANWRTVMDDLTPDRSDLNGRPPRTQFWAKDLTEMHEEFHANDRKTRAPAALQVASTWLGTQQAATAADVGTLLGQVPGRMVALVSAGMTMPGKEERAYGDGANAYSRRANAIWTLGQMGYY
jgi:hypothetical protein